MAWRITVMAALLCQLCACKGNVGGGRPPDGSSGAPTGGGGGASGASGAPSGGTAGGLIDPMNLIPNPCRTDGVISPGPAPLRRLTRFEINNTVRDLFDDSTQPAHALPSEELGSGFGNDANAQSVSALLAEQYGAMAEGIATRATASSEQLAKLAPCAGAIDAATSAADETACARQVIESLVPRAYRRPLEAGEADELLAFRQMIRDGADFATSIAALIEVVVQSPEFLYRVEWGTADPTRTDVLRPSGNEMAVRLSYLLWGTQPDDELRRAAGAGELQTAEGVYAQAERMLDDPRARAMVRFFFDNVLPIASLSGLERDGELFPDFTPAIGALMREEIQTFLEYEIFDGPGTWPSALTAPYTFVNEPLAAFYGMTGVTGDAFQKVPLDASKRLGLLTLPGMLAGTTHSNNTSPVVRGGFIMRKLLCKEIPLPTVELLGEEAFAMVKPPEPYTGDTARERYRAHSEQQICAQCHVNMDPVGFALENFDAVGRWRDTENGVTIDASGTLPTPAIAFNGPVELARALATTQEVETCFASHWMNLAYARSLGDSDECSEATVQETFAMSGYDVRTLLLSLTQTDAFLYLPTVRE
jgi:hypothetical protein